MEITNTFERSRIENFEKLKPELIGLNELRIKILMKTTAVIKDCSCRVRVEEMFSPTNRAVVLVRKRNGNLMQV